MVGCIGFCHIGFAPGRRIAKQSGAVEACWAHNPEVRGSKPRSAKRNLLLIALIVSVSRGLVANRKMFERVDSASFLVRVQR